MVMLMHVVPQSYCDKFGEVVRDKMAKSDHEGPFMSC
jgi:hypothetical protein